MLNVTGAIVNVTDALLNVTGAIVNVTDAMLNVTGAIVNVTDAMLNVTGAIVNVTDAMLKSKPAVNQTVVADFAHNIHPFISIGSPVVASFGLVGNILAFVIMAQLAKTSSFYLYLAVLALADFAVLLTGGVCSGMVLAGHYNPYKSVTHLCSALFSTFLQLSQFSAWITVAVTIDRYIAVCHPFKVTKYCTKKRAIVYLSVAFLVLIGFNFPAICFEWNSDYSSCVIPKITNDYCFKYRPFIDFTTYLLIPAVLICFFNLLIVRGLYKASKFRLSLSTAHANAESTTSDPKDPVRRTTFMLFAVTAVFIITMLPLGCLMLYIMITERTHGDMMQYTTTLSAAAEFAALINHSVNFLLYGLSGKVFRNKFLSLFRCCRTKFVESTTSSTLMSR